MLFLVSVQLLLTSSQSYDELAYHIGQMEDIIKKELEITDPDFYVELTSG